MKKRSKNTLEAHFRQLCLLGIDGKLLMPALERALRELIPSHNTSFVWLNPAGNVVDGYVAHPIGSELESLYFQEKPRWESELGLGEKMYQWQLLQSKPVIQLEDILKVDRRAFERHELYDLFCRPSGWHRSLHAAFFGCDQLTGGLSLIRAQGEKDFTDDEKQLLARVLPFLEHALSVQTDYNDAWLDSGELGLFIFDRHYNLCHANSIAMQLLCFVDYSVPSPHLGENLSSPGLKNMLRRLCHQLMEGWKNDNSGPPVIHYKNNWGKFTFRAHWLAPSSENNDALIGITVQRQEPIALKLLHRLKNSPLSLREKEVCLQMSLGYSYSEIANKLSLSKRTIVTYSQNIFNKLGVSNRKEIINVLLAESDVLYEYTPSQK